jgi:pimeloyl-ACP methyl ester carboxylesterase
MADAVAVKYYMALPKGWSPTESWPILVAIPGAGHDFLGTCKTFARARGDRHFIIVTPCVSSNGNDPADLEAVLAIVKEVQKAFKGQPKFLVTGFSAGGHLAWQLVFLHPELLLGAAPAAANFRFRGISAVSNAKERAQLPIHGFNGVNDKPAINQQWDDAVQYARQHGYRNLSHDLVQGAGHQPFADQVVSFFSTLIAK